MRLAAHKLSADLPRGWDGRIYARHVEVAGAAAAERTSALPPRTATLHAANFPLPARDGDFGTAATAGMSEQGAFLALTEYVEGNGLRAGRGLFGGDPPRSLRPSMFSPHTLLLARPGQAGFQSFFTRRGRPFCLYVVLGSERRAPDLLGPLNDVLGSLAIEPGRP